MQLLRHLSEDFDLIQDPKYINKIYVRITDLHQEGLDISLDNNPVVYDIPIHIHVNNKTIKIPVISIFKRKPYNKKSTDIDGNPVLYALKKEHNYEFYTPADKKLLLDRFKTILTGVFKNIDGTVILPNKKSIYVPQSGIAVPSNNELQHIIENAIKETNPNINILTCLLRKLSADEVARICCMPDSLFRKYWYKKGKSIDEIIDLQDELSEILDDMPNNKFKRHNLPKYLRPSVLTTLELTKNISAYKPLVTKNWKLITNKKVNNIGRFTIPEGVYSGKQKNAWYWNHPLVTELKNYFNYEK